MFKVDEIDNLTDKEKPTIQSARQMDREEHDNVN
jgi:hypothetical protein